MRLLIALFAALSALSVAGCAEDETAPTAAPSATSTAVPPGPQADWKPSDDPKLAKFMGLVAPKPATWTERPPSGLGRVANYTVPGRDGSEAAHVVVHYFGRGLGGDVESNIERWQNQFRSGPDGTPPDPIVENFEADTMPVTLVELAGEWMPMGQSWYTKDQLFIAAIVATTEGSVFIRFAGQTATVEANRQAFMEMVKGLRRGDPST
ncbi:MAG: hypothetical protein ACYS15_02570 [Planctomycetota bacterium]|jgi:hypothetical protein